MGQDISVDFGLLGKPPDFVGDYVNAFKVGRDIARQGAVDRAGAAPAGAVNPLTGRAAADPALAARLGAMSPAERVGAGRRADLLAAVGLGLKGVPYKERPAVLAHLTPALTARGVPPEAIAGFDPTDDALDAAVASARLLESSLADDR